MDGVIKIVEKLLLDSLILSPAPSNPYQKLVQCVLVFSLILLLAGLLICLYSLYLYLLLYYPLHVAVVVIGTFCACMGGVIIGITLYFIQYQKNKLNRISRKVTEKIKLIVSEIDDEWGYIIRENPKIAVLVSTLLGFVIEQNINKEGN